ncbi:MAG: MoaA/NifB/PqqE/SkfB family radical SAM enzyme [Bradymonadia bacterium]|jgi:MoaA/NifB/PqqE/SkfB family radical SAM enzyme
MKLPRALSEIAPKLAGYKLAYHGLAEPPAPINLTLSVTNMCNSRCQSCDIWKIYPAEKEKLKDELNVDEINSIFRKIGQVYFFNISGGEPFLRKDILEIVKAGCIHLKPTVVHIPTNALSPDRIASKTEEILIGMREWAPGVKLTLKPSFDGVGEFHDWVRGIPGNYKKLEITLAKLAELRQKYDHFRVGIGTVISTMNMARLPEIIDQAARFHVDTYISEVAEEREEMRNVATGITPTHEQYGEAIARFRSDTFERLKEAGGLELLTQGMRHQYYEITRRWIRDRKQVVPCYAGISNAHISAYGDLWPCAILAGSKSLGNLKDVDYDFWKLWHSSRADEVRAGIKRGECDCPLANQSYANMLLSPRAMARVGVTVAQAKVAKLRGDEPEVTSTAAAPAPVAEASPSTAA